MELPNPPSERDWTPEEMEEFFSSQDAITGLPNSALAGMPTNALPFRPTASINHCGDELAKEWERAFREPKESPGIHVTRVGEPEQGWLMSFYCPKCRETTFLLSPYACRPKDGDYWRMNEMCTNETLAFKHNMQMGMKGWNDPIELKPSNPMIRW